MKRPNIFGILLPNLSSNYAILILAVFFPLVSDRDFFLFWIKFIQAVHSGSDLESAIDTCLSVPEVIPDAVFHEAFLEVGPTFAQIFVRF